MNKSFNFPKYKIRKLPDILLIAVDNVATKRDAAFQL